MRINYSLIVGSVIILFPLLTFSQVTDTITIHHKYYSTTFSKSKRFPVVVKYWLTKSMLDCEHRYKRSNKFKPDPLIPEYTNLDKDYKKSGYDRGHQMDAYDCGCDSAAMAESFYYSNVAPQVPALNRGNWKRLEDYTRKLVKDYDSVLVWCGSVSFSNRYIGRVAIPDYCWKFIYTKKLRIVKAYSFWNDWIYEKQSSLYDVPIGSIQNMTGFVFITK
jgi:endonuclease G, mitochondrial